jgi:hypothetical protein
VLSESTVDAAAQLEYRQRRGYYWYEDESASVEATGLLYFCLHSPFSTAIGEKLLVGVAKRMDFIQAKADGFLRFRLNWGMGESYWKSSKDILRD